MTGNVFMKATGRATGAAASTTIVGTATGNAITANTIEIANTIATS